MTATIARPATPAQLSFITDLARKHVVNPAHLGRLNEKIAAGQLERSVASETIDWLKRQPVRTAAPAVSAPAPSVPAGRYALEVDGGVKFYLVDRPTEGRWAGRTFVSVQASDDKYPVRNPESRNDILAAIAVNPKEAMLRYGRELGHCGHCGRTLTNDESRERGIGPVCAAKMGY
jgi:hypothetical protein